MTLMNKGTDRFAAAAASPASASIGSTAGAAFRLAALGPVAVMCAAWSVLFFLAPQMMSLRGLTAYSLDAAPVIILVLASTLPMLMGGIDLSVAAMATFAGVCVALLSPTLNSGAIAATLAIAAIIGALHGYGRAKLQLPSFIISLGMLSLLSGLSLLLSNATALSISPSVTLLSVLAGKTWGVPRSVFVLVAVTLLMVATLRYTVLGRAVYAIGSNERAALLSGLPVTATYAIAYAISAASAALAGIVLVSQTFYSAPDFANNLLLPAIVGVLLGGTSLSGGIGGVGHSIVGGITATVIRMGAVVLGFSPAFQDVAFGAVVVLAVAISIDRSKLQIIK